MEGYVVLCAACYLLLMVLAAILRNRTKKKQEQDGCPYCHGRKMLTGNHGKTRLSYKDGAWRISTDACGHVGTICMDHCPECGRELFNDRRKK